MLSLYGSNGGFMARLDSTLAPVIFSFLFLCLRFRPLLLDFSPTRATTKTLVVYSLVSFPDERTNMVMVDRTNRIVTIRSGVCLHKRVI